MAISKVNGHSCLLCLSETLTVVATSAVRGQQDLTVTLNTEMTEVSSPTSGRSAEFIPGVTDWKVDVSGLYQTDSHRTLAMEMMAGTKLSVAWKVKAGGVTETWSGKCFISSFSMGAPVRGKITYSVSLTGSGPLTITT